ncbi:hypothetical protein [Paenibacillus lentus]|uniref:hypothetical protein n=1 Tax=Paenibacillus lentus TaxID=1338368 RepID=UPI00268A6344
MNREIMSEEWNINFINGIFINKSRILKCIDIILTKEGVIFDDVCMIATYNMYDNDDPDKCKPDEVVFSKEFPGYPEELSYLKYTEFQRLIEDGLKKVIFKFEEKEQLEILNEFERAKESLLDN